MKSFASSLALFFLLTPSAFAGHLTASSVKVYRSGDGIKAYIVGLKKDGKATDDTLIKITNSGSDWDNKIQLHKMVSYNDKIDYKTKVKNKDYVTVAIRNPGAEKPNTELYLPERKDEVKLTFDKKLTDAFDGAPLVAEYEKTH